MTVSVTSKPSTMERQTQTEVWIPKWRQFLYCLAGDEEFRFAVFIFYLETPRKYVYRVSFTLSVPLHLYLYISIVF